MAENPPAGWYDTEDGRRRWWDGTAWTDHFEAAQPASTVEGASSIAGEVAQGADDPEQPRPRRVWPWVVAGVGVLVLGGLATAVVLIANLLLSPSLDARGTVAAFDRAWNEGDCTTYFATTTATYRESAETRTCDEFIEAAEELVDYEISFLDAYEDTDVAYVTTSEFWRVVSSDRNSSGSFMYTLVRQDSRWAIDSIESLDADE